MLKVAGAVVLSLLFQTTNAETRIVEYLKANVVPGRADVVLRIMEADPRVPKFIERNPKTGEITRVDIGAVKASPQFSRVLERTIAGWPGIEAPVFSLTGYDGNLITSAQFNGQPHLVYFWFTNCPPCVKTSPILTELYN